MSEQWEPEPGDTGWVAPDASPVSAGTTSGAPTDQSEAAGANGVTRGTGASGGTGQIPAVSRTGQSGDGYPTLPAAPFAGPSAASGGPDHTATDVSPPAFPSEASPSAQQPFSVYQQHYYPFATAPVGPAPVSTSAATTRAAAIIQLVQSVVWLFGGVVLLVLAGKPDSYFAERVDLEDSNLTFEDVRVGMVFLAVLIFLAVVAMTVLAILVLRRINGCRIASAVLQIVFGSLLLIIVAGSLGSGDLLTVLLGLLLVLAGVAAAILLFLSSTARYCAARRPAGLRY